jgi:hypothetical protein
LKAQHVSRGIPLIFRSSKLYLQPLVYIPIWWPYVVRAGWELQVPTQAEERPVTKWVYKPEAANRVSSSWRWAVCRSKHVEPSINSGIIDSIARFYLVGYFYWFVLRWTDPWILNLFCFTRGMMRYVQIVHYFSGLSGSALYHAVVQFVEALRYKSEGCELDSRWCCCNFSLTYSFKKHYSLHACHHARATSLLRLIVRSGLDVPTFATLRMSPNDLKFCLNAKLHDTFGDL